MISLSIAHIIATWDPLCTGRMSLTYQMDNDKLDTINEVCLIFERYQVLRAYLNVM